MNSVTNRIYVPSTGNTDNGTSVTVIDGGTNAVIAIIPGFIGPRYAAVNEVTNTNYYVTNAGGTTVTVIDGATSSVTGTVTVAGRPFGIAVNPITDRGSMSPTARSSSGLPRRVQWHDQRPGRDGRMAAPWSVAVNAATNKFFYVSNFFGTNTILRHRWRLEHAQGVDRLHCSPTPSDVTVDPVSNRVYVAGGAPIR